MESFSTYDEVASSDLPSTVLTKVISRAGKSKNYTDLIPLDGGTVGIAHFATGGLSELYKQMDTQEYFGRSQEDMISHYSAKCRPSGKKGNDTGWGCYSQAWWHEGMARFLASPESEKAQYRAWLNLMQPAIKAALAHNWTDRRSLAIAMGIANSLGSAGLNSLATKHNWHAEQVLTAYVGTDAHRARRRDALNAAFGPK
ncbi:hypothetical protein [Mesorhizobium sp. KR2-14]|uniref:hypothetical protein n=1 Tax=Mesorhizobium sp. KR2-14 TaxID=3156610 RepID=UPI0032B3F37C